MAISTAALKAAYATEIAKISNTLEQARATVALDRYIQALTTQNALEANEIQSYSIAGRTVTRRDSSMALDHIDRLEAQLVGMCYGTVTLADLNTQVAEPYGREIT